MFFLNIIKCQQQNKLGFGSAKYVLILGCDGLGADYLIQANNTPNFDSLRNEGSYSFQARNVWPTWSLPNWASIITSGGTEETGVPGNGWYNTNNCLPYGSVYSPECLVCGACETVATGLLTGFQYLPNLYNLTESVLDDFVKTQCTNIPIGTDLCEEIGDSIVDFIINGGLLVTTDANQICVDTHLCARFLRPLSGPQLPSIFSAAKAAKPGIKIACFTDWTGINQLVEPNVIDFFRYANAGAPYRSSIIVSDLISIVEKYTPELTFIHFDDIDETGHANGWGSDKYYEAISLVDYEIGLILDAYDNIGILNDTLILVISDHGGNNAEFGGGKSGHGYTNQEDITIPWIAKGPGINSNYIIQSYVRNMDTPATALYGLGIEQPNLWMGKPTTEIWDSIPYSSPLPPSIPLTNTVISITLSGLNSLGLKLADTPNIDNLIKLGSFAQHARAQMPTTTLTNIASIIMGSGPEETGVCQGPFPDANSNSCQWNGVNDSLVPPISGPGTLFPSIFQVLENNMITNTAAVYRYANISKLISPTSVNQFLENSDYLVSQKVSNLLSSNNPPNYIFAQFWDIQNTAITHGYDSPEYLLEISKIDTLLYSIISNMSNNTILLITSDHGGIGTENGNLDDKSIIIPFIAYGPGIIKSNYRIPTHVRNMDAASIALYSLGYQQPVYWVSNTHSEIFY